MSELVLEKPLPEEWIITNLENVSTITSGNSAPQGKKFFEKGEFPFVRVADMGKTSGVYLNKTQDHVNKLGGKKLKMFPKGSVLFTKSGASTHLNQKSILGMDSYVVSHIGLINPLGEISSEFIYYFLKTIDFKLLTHESIMPSLQLSKIKNLNLPLPPLNEQQRIVAKIEELFSHLDHQTNLINQNIRLLQSFEKSILRDTFSGKLTKVFRETHSCGDPQILLNKIKEERKSKNLVNIPEEIPENYDSEKNWRFSSLGFITQNFDGKRIPVSKTKRKDMKGDFPYYGASGIIDYVNRPLFKGKYLLIGEDGANLLARSTPIAFIADGEFWVNNHAHVLQTLGGVDLEYLSYFINSIDLSEWISGTAQPKLNQRNMSKIPIPIPSLEEQEEIKKIIHQNLSIIKKQSDTLKKLISHILILKMSILNHAFEGKLVPQDPNDESAEILLKQIKN